MLFDIGQDFISYNNVILFFD